MESEEQPAQRAMIVSGHVGSSGHSAPGTGTTVGIVYGGVLGGLVGLTLLVLLIFLIITKAKTGHWGLKFW